MSKGFFDYMYIWERCRRFWIIDYINKLTTFIKSEKNAKSEIFFFLSTTTCVLFLTLTRAVECRRDEKTTCRRRDAPLDTKSNRASPSHTSRPSWNNPMVRKLALSLFSSRRKKKENTSTGDILSSLVVRAERFITASGRRATLKSSGERSEGLAKRISRARN